MIIIIMILKKYRDSVMRVLARLDPRGSRERRRNRLTRTQEKVHFSQGVNFIYNLEQSLLLRDFCS